jgi:hypothetical protein
MNSQSTAVAIGAGLFFLGREAGSVVMEVVGAIIALCALTHNDGCVDCANKSAAKPEATSMAPKFGSKKEMRPTRNFVVRRIESYVGPPEQGAIGLPTGQRRGVTTAFSLLTRGDGLRKIPQAGALQFGTQPMGGQKRLVRA